MSKTMYLDNASTTQVDEQVVEAMLPFFHERYGNPGSLHQEGIVAKTALRESRKRIADILGANSEEIIFTGSGTESINLALKGATMHYSLSGKKDKNHIITQKTEHKAVLETFSFLESVGWKVTYLDVDRYGMIRLDDLRKAITEKTFLVSIMYANNEIGTVQPIEEIAAICKERNVLFHTDACQAAGYEQLGVKQLGVDLLSLNASKVYGPKGIGLLYVKQGVGITPLIHGGGQERNIRSGTENVAFIVGFAKALELAETKRKEETRRIRALSDKLTQGILKKIPKTFLNGHPTKRLPNNVSLTFLDIEGEAAVSYLDREGICASTGSACTAQTLEPSHVLLATGIAKEAAHSSVRFSLGRHTKESDIDRVLDVLPDIIKELRNLSPVQLEADAFANFLNDDNKKISGL